MISPTVSPEEGPWKVEINLGILYKACESSGEVANGICRENGVSLEDAMMEHYENSSCMTAWLRETAEWLDSLPAEYVRKRLPSAKGWVYHFRTAEAASIFKLFRGQW